MYTSQEFQNVIESNERCRSRRPSLLLLLLLLPLSRSSLAASSSSSSSSLTRLTHTRLSVAVSEGGGARRQGASPPPPAPRPPLLLPSSCSKLLRCSAGLHPPALQVKNIDRTLNPNPPLSIMALQPQEVPAPLLSPTHLPDHPSLFL
jgi:hypothetical protein